MYKTGTKVIISHPSWEGQVGVVRGIVKSPKYPRGWQASYIVQVGADKVALSPSLVRKLK